MPPKRIITRIINKVRPATEEVLPANEHLRELRRKFEGNMRRGVPSVHVKGYAGGTSMTAIHETPDGVIGMDKEGNVYRIGARAAFLMPKKKLDKKLGR